MIEKAPEPLSSVHANDGADVLAPKRRKQLSKAAILHHVPPLSSIVEDLDTNHHIYCDDDEISEFFGNVSLQDDFLSEVDGG